MIDQEHVHETVRAHYAEAARAVRERRSNAEVNAACCSADDPAGGWGEILYGATDLDELPDAARLASLGCGNPTAVAELRPGERVLDLGSGGGIDVILSARRVGPTGRAIGLDMTDEMLELASRNVAESGLANIELMRGTIESIPLPASSVDVVISNCVINLAADKAAVFAEIARVLRPGGRIGISDVVAEDRLSPTERAERGSFSGCIAGALSATEYRAGLAAVGLDEISIEPTHAVADGLHGAIVKAVKPVDWAARRSSLPVMPALPVPLRVDEVTAAGCGCGEAGCC